MKRVTIDVCEECLRGSAAHYCIDCAICRARKEVQSPLQIANMFGSGVRDISKVSGLDKKAFGEMVKKIKTEPGYIIKNDVVIGHKKIKLIDGE